ncbi:MAG: FHA domain-containing protein [Cellulomonadaceae bacterium]
MTADPRGDAGSEAPASSGPSDPETTAVFGAIGAGAPQDDQFVVRVSADEHAAIAALPATSALLIMQRGPSAGARFLLDAERTTAGRSERADIFLDDVTVSRKHALFMRDGNRFAVRDSGSLNGTYVNRERIDTAWLRTGDEVQIGKYRMTFHASPQSGSGQEHAEPGE